MCYHLFNQPIIVHLGYFPLFSYHKQSLNEIVMYIPLLLVVYENAYLPTSWTTNKYAFPCLSNGSIGENWFLPVLMLWLWNLRWFFSRIYWQTFLPFPVPLWGHIWLFPGWIPILPNTDTSVSFWPGILLHSAGSSQVLPSSQFWLASGHVCQASLLCLQSPSAKETKNNFFVLVLCLGKWLCLHTSMENIYKW